MHSSDPFATAGSLPSSSDASGPSLSLRSAASGPSEPTSTPERPARLSIAALGDGDADGTIPLQDLKLGKLIGRGSFATVREARWHGSRVAAKCIVLPPEWTNGLATSEGQERTVKRLHREIRVLRSLNHPSVVRFFGVAWSDGASGEDGGGGAPSDDSFPEAPCAHIVTELAEEGTLADLLARERRGLPPARALSLAEQLLAGVAYTHARQVVHRDIKPANLLLFPGERLKLTDFGFSMFREAAGLSATMSLGTPAYAAPEMLECSPPDFPNDVYGAAIVVNELFSGEQPYPSLRPFQITYQVTCKGGRPRLSEAAPPPLRALIQRMWAQDPAQRPTAAEALASLSDILEPLRSPAASLASPGAPRSPARRPAATPPATPPHRAAPRRPSAPAPERRGPPPSRSLRRRPRHPPPPPLTHPTSPAAARASPRPILPSPAPAPPGSRPSPGPGPRPASSVASSAPGSRLRSRRPPAVDIRTPRVRHSAANPSPSPTGDGTPMPISASSSATPTPSESVPVLAPAPHRPPERSPESSRSPPTSRSPVPPDFPFRPPTPADPSAPAGASSVASSRLRSRRPPSRTGLTPTAPAPVPPSNEDHEEVEYSAEASGGTGKVLEGPPRSPRGDTPPAPGPEKTSSYPSGSESGGPSESSQRSIPPRSPPPPVSVSASDTVSSHGSSSGILSTAAAAALGIAVPSRSGDAALSPSPAARSPSLRRPSPFRRASSGGHADLPPRTPSPRPAPSYDPAPAYPAGAVLVAVPFSSGKHKLLRIDAGPIRGRPISALRSLVGAAANRAGGGLPWAVADSAMWWVPAFYEPLSLFLNGVPLTDRDVLTDDLVPPFATLSVVCPTKMVPRRSLSISVWRGPANCKKLHVAFHPTRSVFELRRELYQAIGIRPDELEVETDTGVPLNDSSRTLADYGLSAVSELHVRLPFPTLRSGYGGWPVIAAVSPEHGEQARPDALVSVRLARSVEGREAPAPAAVDAAAAIWVEDDATGQRVQGTASYDAQTRELAFQAGRPYERGRRYRVMLNPDAVRGPCAPYPAPPPSLSLPILPTPTDQGRAFLVGTEFPALLDPRRVVLMRSGPGGPLAELCRNLLAQFGPLAAAVESIGVVVRRRRASQPSHHSHSHHHHALHHAPSPLAVAPVASDADVWRLSDGDELLVGFASGSAGRRLVL
eukprot:tig00021015_g17160.t1